MNDQVFDQPIEEGNEVEGTIDEQAPESELDIYKRGWQRAQADYQNLQKEVSEMKRTWAKLSEAQILEEFIPIYDNFKKAFSSKPTAEDAAWENWAKGIEYIKQQYADVFARHDLKEMSVVGEQFDPTKHECVKEMVSDKPEGEVIEEVASGFFLGDSVFVPAKVIISSQKET